MSHSASDEDRRLHGSALPLSLLTALCLYLLCGAASMASAASGIHSVFREGPRSSLELRGVSTYFGSLKGVGSLQSFAGEEIEPYSPHPSETRPYAVCPPPTKVRVSCLTAAVPTEGGEPVLGPNLEGSGTFGGFSPADLRSAYNLPGEGGEGQTVAITIAYDNPKAEADLAIYRNHYGLPPCTTANGCFEKVNQKGEAGNYPAANAEWALETSLDLDMVSATCPNCRILLVEADSNSLDDMGAAVQKAAELGATVISNSWATEEFPEEIAEDHYFTHPGIPTLFASGDWGYGVYYPAASPGAVAVGGTSLEKAANARGWSEMAWSGAGSGCSQYEPKPSWQKDVGCPNRTVADISAVSDPSTPVSVYDSYEESGWKLLGGTSVATPIMAGVEALSSSAFRAGGPSAFPRVGNGGGVFDVTEGENGTCSRESTSGFGATYLCQADVGYDGPTGWGTPDGPLSLPVAITEAAKIVSNDKAILHGSVDPRGLDTKYRFEYGETPSYGTDVPIPDESAGSGSGYVDISQAIGGLHGKTPYHYRIVATNSTGTFPGVDRIFGTSRPTATTGGASEVHVSDATLHATINPEGLDTTYYFEYGLSTSYEFKAPVKANGIGEGIEDIEATTEIDTLASGQAYHYRVVAKNVAGTVYGRDRSFVTEPSKWAIDYLPKESGGDRPFGISCTEPDNCVMVGSQFNPTLVTFVTLAKTWDGHSWHPMQTPNPSGLGEGLSPSSGALLGSVSCSSAEDCLAVGRYRNSEGVKPLAEHWDGSEWTITPLPEPSGMTRGQLQSVSCTSATGCSAVGYFASDSGVEHTLAVRWDGVQWEIQPTPNPSGSGDSRLTGISCSSAVACTASGVYDVGPGAEAGFAAHWDGAEWTIQPVPGPTGSSRFGLSEISCTATSTCSAVGYVTDPAGSRRPLAEHWDGSEWTVMPTPSLPPGKGGELDSISCVSSTECTASGSLSNIPAKPEEVISAQIRWLVERWDGDAWTVLEVGGVPVPAGWWHDDFLESISCPKAEVCRGIGYGTAAPEGGLSPLTAIALRELAPPFAGFSTTPEEPFTGDPVNFDASSTTPDPGHPISQYAWEFGDGSNGTGEAPSHAYARAGDHIATLTVTDDRGRIGTISHVVTVTGRPPEASFDVTTASPAVAQPVAFDGSASSDSDGTVVSYDWDFGDGAVGSGSTPSHIYTEPGDYIVTLTVTDDEELIGETSHLVNIAAVAPVASFSATPESPLAGELVSFDGSASSDSDGTIESYEWSFGDGTHGSGKALSHAFVQSGDYSVTLTVTDDEGLTGEASDLVSVADPHAVADVPPQVFDVTPAAHSNLFTRRYVTTRCDGRIVLSVYAASVGSFQAHGVARAVPHRRPGHTSGRSRNHRAPCLIGHLVQPTERGRSQFSARPRGDITLSHRRYVDYGSGSVVSDPSKAVELTIQPRTRIFALLRRALELRVRIAIAFTPQNGTPAVEHQTVVVRSR